MSADRIKCLRELGLLEKHDEIVTKIQSYGRIFRVRNLEDEIWLVKGHSFVPGGDPECRVILEGVVDELSLSEPYAAFKSLKKAGATIETVGWKS